MEFRLLCGDEMHLKGTHTAVAPPYTILSISIATDLLARSSTILLVNPIANLNNTKTNYTQRHKNTMKTLKKQKELLELKLARKLITETRDTLTAIAKNEDKHKKNDTMLPFPIEEIQVHLLDEDGEGMVLWLQGSIEKGKILIEKGFEELTDHEETIQVELESDEEEDHMIEEMFTTVNKKHVLLN